MDSNHFTRFVAERIAGSMADCLCFGDPFRRLMDRNGRAICEFRAGQLFAVVWWRRYSEDRQHRTLAVVEAISTGKLCHILPGIHPGVAVHVLVRQHGPAGQDETVDQLLDLIEDLKHRGRNPAELPAAFWTEAARELLICQVPLESFDLESMVCRA